MIRIRAFALLILITTACSQHATEQTTLPYFNTPDFTPTWADAKTIDQQTLHSIPAFSFTDQDGNNVSDMTVNDKIYVVDFFFTHCQSICPKLTENMGKVAQAFLKDNHVMMLSHSVTPELDNMMVLKNYARQKNITNPNWRLLTGDKKQIYDLARKGYFADNSVGYNKDFTEFLHTENFVLVDKHRHIRGVYNGTVDFEMDNLIRHIKLLEKE